MPLGFHGLDLVVIAIIALLIFGPKRLPEISAAVGKSIQEFRKGMNSASQEEAQKEPITREAKSIDAMSIEAIEQEIARRKTVLMLQEAEQRQRDRALYDVSQDIPVD